MGTAWRTSSKRVAGRGADGLGGGIWGVKPWVVAFELHQAVEQLVVFGVGNFGVVEDVIAVQVVAHLSAEVVEFLGYVQVRCDIWRRANSATRPRQCSMVW